MAAADFTNSWANNAAVPDLSNLAYTKTEGGWVEIKGLISGGTSGTSAFTIPEHFRPDSSRIFGGANTSGANAAWVEVTAAGLLIPRWSGGGTPNVTITASYSAARHCWEDAQSGPWPKFVKLDRNNPPRGVFIAKNWYDDPDHIHPHAVSAGPIYWTTVGKRDGTYLKIEHIYGLFHRARNTVRLMIVW